MKVIYFVRHGECQANADGLIAGPQNDSPLTKKGEQQADETAEALRGKPIELIIASPLCRAKDTAARIAEKLGYQGETVIEPLLIERDFGAATGQPKNIGFVAIDSGEIEDIEQLEQLAQRMQRALEQLKALPQRHILVVGHGGTECMLRTIYEGRSPQTFLDTEPLENAQIHGYTL